ncbi:MAG: NAD-dependent protein deacylase [Alphaproteobacteria bacterium]|nr:NAD-dependent protein deacylase [Alphaproteobacteria bacterium]
MNIVVLTGAGISKESGLNTFRDEGGLWAGHKVEDVATPEAFVRNPALVHDFYNQRRAQLFESAVKPNAGHLALAEFEKDGKANSFLLVTQNVDNLHEQAGSKNLLHMHGDLLSVRCTSCGHKQADWKEQHTTETICTACSVKGTTRPDIVWFGEMPYFMDEIYKALMNCDLFMAIGTSGHVYPAAGFVELANAAGARTVEFNLDHSAVSHAFDEHLLGSASETLPKFLKNI